LIQKEPFFLYYAPGGTHAPHQPTQEWIDKFKDKFKGKFHVGWNALRETIFANQKRLDVIPQDAELTPPGRTSSSRTGTNCRTMKRSSLNDRWKSTAYLAYSDFEIGRVIQALDDMGKLDNTLIIYISAEGGLFGTPNEMTFFNGVEVPVAQQMSPG
jgi:arylsulfatase A-like enzyme